MKTDATHKKMQEELDFKQLQLNSILEITQAINQNFSSDQLLSIYQFVIRNQLKIGKLVLYIVVGKKWRGVLNYGIGSGFKSVSVPENLSPINDIVSVDENHNQVFGEFETVIPVFHKDKALAYALIGDYKDKYPDPKYNISAFVQTITNLIVVAMENKRLARELVKQEGMKRELQLAAEMQATLFPASLPELENIEMHATYLPFQEVGGDYYDFIPLNDDEALICMADVSGKGLAAALLMANFQANLRVLANFYPSFSDLMTRLNSKVMGSAKGEKYITLFIARFNNKTRQLEYVNAGHNPPLLYFNGKILSLEEGTVGLGMFDELPFLNIGKVTLEPGAEVILLSYTDGVIDLENDQGNRFGTDRLMDFLSEHAHLRGMKVFNDALVRKLNEFRGKKPFVDDIALLSCRGKF